MILVHDGIETHISEYAVPFIFDNKIVWIPKSQILYYDDDTVEVEDCIAVEKELEEYEL